MTATAPAGPELLEEGAARELLERALAASPASETEVSLTARSESLTRFAADGITQNIAVAEASIAIRAVEGRRCGRASTNDFSTPALERAARAAHEAARVAAEDPEAPELPGPQEYAGVDHFDPATLAETPAERAERVAAAAAAVRAHGFRPAGTALAAGEATAVANSRGVFAFWRGTTAAFAVSALGDDASGWAERVSRGPSGVDAAGAAASALEKARRGRERRDLEPGDYPAVLEPAALTDLLLFLGQMTFAGLPFVEGRSLVSGRLGEAAFSRLVTLSDDVFHPLTQGPPFDAEGMPRRAVRLIDGGRIAGVVHDRRTARLAGAESTGHALPQPSATGPLPENLVLHPGDASRDDLVRSLERGVLISRLHYVNVLDPKAMTLTGMTRDGTFLIENGEIVAGVRDLRFEDDATRILGGIEAVGRDLALGRAFFGGAFVAPAVRLRAFHLARGAEL